MARIWYSVCGEGLGHAIRSGVVISELIKNHDVKITAANRAYPYLKKKFGKAVIKIEGNSYVYEKNQVNRFKTAIRFVWNLPYQIFKNIRICNRLIKWFRPQIIISDFESASHYFSILHNIPCINIDNIHSLTECVFKQKKPFYIKPIIRFWHPKSKYYLIPSFAFFNTNNKNAVLINPIIRDEILSTKPKKKNFVLVYQTSDTNQRMISVLRKSMNKFKIYGMKRNNSNIHSQLNPNQSNSNQLNPNQSNPNQSNHLEYKSFSEKEFLNDLAECKYVIINGGFTTLTESLYLKKPILSIPIKWQYEQEFNAFNIEKCGFGKKVGRLSLSGLSEFEKNLNFYYENLNKLKTWDNKEFFKKLNLIIKKLTL